MRACTCPNCGANIEVETDNRDFAFCQYCGAKITFDDYRSTHRIVDEAKVKEVESNHVVRMKELAMEQVNHAHRSRVTQVVTWLWVILSFAIIVACFVWFAILKDEEVGSMIMLTLGFPVVGGGAALVFGVLPAKEAEKELIKRGGIRFPSTSEMFSKQNYVALQSALDAAGFTNVTCVNLHDVKIGLLQKPNLIESVTVNGKSIYSGGKVYMPDVPVIITYHGR